MFDNIGGKIKGLAKFVCWAGIVMSVLMGILTMVGASQSSSYGYGYRSSGGAGFLGGLIVMVAGGLGSWLGSLALYGFGELVDNVSSIAGKMATLNSDGSKSSLSQVASLTQRARPSTPSRPLSQIPALNQHSTDSWICKNCNEQNPSIRTACQNCGMPR